MQNNISILVFTKIFGTFIGLDRLNNRYYQGKGIYKNKRWVLYSNNKCYNSEKSGNNQIIAKEWFNWLYRKENAISSSSTVRKIPSSSKNIRYQKWKI